jgi:hypothetical protein
MSREEFADMLRLRIKHMRLLSIHTPEVCMAPVKIWRSDDVQGQDDWEKYAGRSPRQRVSRGNHFTMMTSPFVEEIVADLLCT